MLKRRYLYMKSPYTQTHITLSAAALLIASTAFSHAQTLRIFLNSDGDNLWSNSLNWDLPDVPDTTSEFARLQGDAIVDQNFTILRVQNAFGSSDILSTSINGGVLTLDASSAGNADVITNVSGNSGSNLQFAGNLEINNSLGGISLLNFANSTSNVITFTETSVLDLTTRLETATGNATSQIGAINFNGRIISSTPGVANLRIGVNDSNITFGVTADNSSYLGDIAFIESGHVVSNTTVPGGFLAGGKVQVNGDGSSLTINGEDTMRGNIVVGGTDATFTANINANQPSMGFLNPNGVNANLVINIAADVTEVNFQNSSSVVWDAGATITITGFQEGEIRFGSDNTALTASQLAAINGGVFGLTTDGYLTFTGQFVDAGKDISLAARLLIPTDFGKTYYIQASDTVDGTYQDLGVIIGSGSVESFVDDRDLSTKQFYKVLTF